MTPPPLASAKLTAFWGRLKPRERSLATVTVVVAGICMFYRLAFVPVTDRLQGIRQELLLQRKQLAAHQRTLLQRDRVSKLYTQYAHLIQPAGLDSDEEETSKLLKEIEVLARSSGVTVVNLKPKPVETTGLVKWYQVVVETEAPLAGIVRFVYEVEQSPQLLRIERLDLKQDEKTQGPLKGSCLVSKVVIP